jgi:hypothetical protein
MIGASGVKGRRAGLFCYLAMGLVLGLGLAGCSAGQNKGGEPTATPVALPAVGEEPTLEPGKYTDARGAPFPVPSTEANPIRMVDRQAAWGTGPGIKKLTASVDADHVLILEGVAPDGRFVAGALVPRSRTSFEASRLVLMDVAGGQVTEVATLPFDYAGNSRGLGLTVDGDWVVWHEAGTLKAYNVATRALSKIEMATDSRAGVPESYVPSVLAVSVDHGVAVWAETTSEKPEQDRVASVVKRADLATGRVSIIGRSGVNPVISWPVAAWIEPDLSTVVEGQALSRLVTLDLETGALRRLGDLHDLWEIAIRGDTIVSQAEDVVYLENLQQTRRQVITPQSGVAINKLTLNERLVTWVSEGSPRVWDMELERLVSLDGYAGSVGGRVVNGHTLAWESAPSYKDWIDSQGQSALPDNLTIYVMDTLRLPK